VQRRARAGRPQLRAAALALTGVAIAPSRADANQEPLWAYGLGVGAVAFQDYPGSDTTRVYPVPALRLLYNGSFLKADQTGVRGLLFDQTWVELNVSGGISAPVHNDAARFGLPPLKATLEIGPSVNFHLFRSESGHVRLDLNVPTRAAFAVAAPPVDIGWKFEPFLRLRVRDAFGAAGWKLDFSAGPMYADKKYDEYFYGVAPRYATAARPAYMPTGGYAGSQFGAGIGKRFPKLWFDASVHYEALGGANFANSPLVRREYDWSVGFSCAWLMGKSSRLVDVGW